MDSNKIASLPIHEKASRALPIISIVASVFSISLILLSLVSVSKQMRHTDMMLDKLQKEEEERHPKK